MPKRTLVIEVRLHAWQWRPTSYRSKLMDRYGWGPIWVTLVRGVVMLSAEWPNPTMGRPPVWTRQSGRTEADD